MAKIKIAIVGLGKIARDQHLPSLNASDAFELVAVASPHDRLDGIPGFDDIGSMLRAMPDIEAIALCTTPQVRYALARTALDHGCHVLLEKPPGVTLGEVQSLKEIAERRGVTLLASWHSRFARGVEPARAWLASRKILNVEITWKENVRVWHPGQAWIWKAGGLGVFDPGINALSILTQIIPGALVLKGAELSFPSNCETPIAAQLEIQIASGAITRVDLDFLQTGPQTWNIDVDTDAGRLALSMGGTLMSIDNQQVAIGQTAEYASLYAHFAQLVQERSSDVDVTPLQLVADAFMCGRHIEVAPFIE
jgi:D-galactose 1-dehydrogenase